MRKSVLLAAFALFAILLMSLDNEKKITVFTIGDSTMANKDISDDKQERGWGMMLQGFFTEDVVVDNHALNGRSSKSFIDEGHWQTVLDKITPGDYVFIQFGHNDEKEKPDRHTDPGSTFDENLKRFVLETRSKGGIPVILNSVVRRNFSGSKTAVADDDLRTNSSADLAEGDTLIDTHGDYAIAPINVAKELDVPFINANKITHDLEQGLGVEGSKKLHMIFEPGETPSIPEGRQDNTHYNVYGATVVAGLIAEQIVKEIPELGKYVCHYDVVVDKEGKGLYFDLQKAIDEAPEGKKVTILLGDGEWKRPTIPEGKDIEIVERSGVTWID